ncbi:MAG TPA: hypothetical protein VJP86_01460 [Vicinamibacterales bacterium]|jgi:hypothetical protein|nr:hypothetical protein [Vicinamibacterales bacterium]
MSAADIPNLVIGALTGILSSSLFILALFIGFCVVVGFTKTKRTAGGNVPVIKSLDEAVNGKAVNYLPPTAPRGHADPLKVWS